MRLILVLAAMLAPAAYAQGVTQADVTPDDLLTLYDCQSVPVGSW